MLLSPCSKNTAKKKVSGVVAPTSGAKFKHEILAFMFSPNIEHKMTTLTTMEFTYSSVKEQRYRCTYPYHFLYVFVYNTEHVFDNMRV